MSNGWDSVQRKYRGTKSVAVDDGANAIIAELRAVPSRNNQVFVGLVALFACLTALYMTIKRTKEQHASLSSVLGDTSLKSVATSSLPGLSFAIFYYGLRANIISKTKVLPHAKTSAVLQLQQSWVPSLS